MTTAGQFIVGLQKARRIGNVSGETEQHLKHEFRRLGWHASDLALATAIGSEIDRLEREAATLRNESRVVRGGTAGVDYEYQRAPALSMNAMITRTIS
jgi:hypothetical protein